MPKKLVDYSKTIMYKIVHNDLTIKDIYIGHTTDFTKRKWCHKKCCNNEKDKNYHLKVYKMIRDKGGWSNWNMILIEEFPCKNILQACKRERELYEQYNANLNTLRPYVSEEEYKEQNKQYRKANREQIQEQKKQYYEANLEKMLEQKKQYYEANKEQIQEQKKKKSNCPHCNKEMRSFAVRGCGPKV